ncbi:MAG: hypothetical protein LBK57_05440 [Clostridiales Family XIII bacterium]|jgi:hypothetical protein|nr:hypothetical protein [Clostridiales Family XIII bacterium]
MLKKSIAGLMAIMMIAVISTVSAFAITPGSYANPSFSTWPTSHGALFAGPAVVTNTDGVSTVTVPINTHFTIHGVTGDITDVTLLSGSPYNSAQLTSGNLIVTCSDSVTAAGFEPELEFEITYATHVNSTSGIFKIQ